jgi:uncharacterized protein YkwD
MTADVQIPTRVRLLTPRIILSLFVVATAFASVSLEPQDATANSEFDEALLRINTYRAWLGIAPIKRHPALDSAAQSHADYYRLNFGDPSLAGVGLHQQSPDKPGFTGSSIADRARAHGYDGRSTNENIGLSGSMIYTVEWSIATVNHRLPLLDPRYDDIGFGAVNSNGVRIEVIMVGAQSWPDTSEPTWMHWPPDGTTGVWLDFWGEAPNPFPGASYPVGYPITLKYYGPGEVAFHSAELYANGAPVPVNASTGTGWLTSTTYMIAASSPLQPDTRYDVRVEATANGAAVTHAWSFRTRASASEPLGRDQSVFAYTIPGGVAAQPQPMQDVWSQADAAVNMKWVDRSWVWGPDVWWSGVEQYLESPGGERHVAYLDKTRMEITDPNGAPASKWHVTNGLLVRDMVRGEIQVGHDAFVPHGPAHIQIAGDFIDHNPGVPTYASFADVSAVIHDIRSTDRTGQPVIQVIDQGGNVWADDGLNGLATHGFFDEVTGFNVADVFHNWFASQSHFEWIYAAGHPIADPYWVRARVGGEEQWVLVQLFQRRVLTYTPSNPDGWKIEMGNVGRHYYTWRYGEAPPDLPE